jgi:hypothetical protein
MPDAPRKDAPKKYAPRLQEASLVVSDLVCQCFTWPVPRTAMHAGLIVFRGTYGHGSAGKDDALFIRWRIRELCELHDPGPISGLLVDFRDMTYTWGDDLTVDAGPFDREPVRVIVRPAQLEAYRYPVGADRLRTDFEEAAAEVSDILRGLRPGDGEPRQG